MRRSLAFIPLLLALAGCAHGGTTSADERRSAPRPLVAPACLRDLETRNGRGEALAVRIAATGARVRALGEEAKPARRRLEVARRKAERGEALVRALEAKAESAAAALRSFAAAHPDRQLPPSLYEQWQALRAEYDAARVSYDRAYASYAALAASHERAQRSYNELVRDHNESARNLTALLRRRARLGRRHHAALERCLERGAATAGAERERTAELEERIAATTARLAGRAATVECEAGEPWRPIDGKDLLGFVTPGSARIHLAPSVCYTLHRLAFLAWRPDLACLDRSLRAGLPLCPPEATLVVRAVTTVTHEAQHVAGVENEAEAECGGLRAAARAARAFGIAPRHGPLLAAYASRFPHTPPSYRASACRVQRALA